MIGEGVDSLMYPLWMGGPKSVKKSQKVSKRGILDQKEVLKCHILLTYPLVNKVLESVKKWLKVLKKVKKCDIGQY